MLEVKVERAESGTFAGHFGSIEEVSRRDLTV